MILIQLLMRLISYIKMKTILDKFLSTASFILKNGYTIKLKRSNVPDQEPFPQYIIPGQLLINTYDKRVWLVDENNIPVELEIRIKNND